MKQALNFLLLIISCQAVAQAPVINMYAPLHAAPTQNVVITGSGFSSTNLRVWFDHVQGTIVQSSPFSIEVQVPAQARLSNIEVINLTTGLSGKSQLKFRPSFGGGDFDVSKISKAYRDSLTNTTEFFDIASADFDLDGKPDLVATKTTIGAPATDLVIYKNQSPAIGSIAFTKFDKSSLPQLDVSAPTHNVACGDLNGDGMPDIVATRDGANANEVFILRNINSVVGTLKFAPLTKVLLDAGQRAFRVSIRDLNQDGKPELIVSNSFFDPVNPTDNIMYVFPNTSVGGAITFSSPIKLTVTGAKNGTYGLEVQDLDGDSKPDIIVNQFQTNDLFIFKNQSSGTISFAPVQQISASGSFNNVSSSDLNNDGLLDMIVTSTLDNNMQIFINNSSSGNISFQAPQVLTTSLGPWGVDVSDIDGDGDADIIVANKNEAKVNVFRQDGTLSFTKLDIKMAKPALNLRVGDYDGDGKPDIAVTSVATSTYTLFSVDVIRNANCVTPVITSPSTTVCSGQTVTIQTTPALGVTFAWTKNGASFPPSTVENANVTYADVMPPGSAIFAVTATAEGGACAVTSPDFAMTSDIGTAPVLAPSSITNSAPCLGGTLSMSTVVTADSYQWTGPDNFTSTSPTPSISPVAAENAGLYSLQVKVGACSSNVVTKLLDVYSVPVLPVGASPSTTVCKSTGNVVTLSVSGSGYTFQWNNNGAAISGETGSSLAATTDGDYSVVVKDGTTTCTQETDKTTVNFLTVPVVDFSFSGACKGAVVSFTDMSTNDARGTPVYAWNFDGTSTSATQNPTFTYNTAGPFSPSLNVSYSGVSGCAGSISKPITVIDPVVPSIAAGSNPICENQSTTLSITGSFTSISWSGDNGLSGSTSSVTITQPGSYTVNATDANGCTSSATIAVTTNPPISPFAVTADKTSVKPGDPVQLSATAGLDAYAWLPAETLDNPAIATPIAKPAVTTTYKVTASKSGFCDAVDSVKVNVDTGGGANIHPPLIFSPNGDTFNDSWKIPDTDSYPDCTMTIYDGHGSEVYQQKGYNSGNYWDGTYSGKNVPDGTYFYVFGCPNLKPVSGNVLIVR